MFGSRNACCVSLQSQDMEFSCASAFPSAKPGRQHLQPPCCVCGRAVWDGPNSWGCDDCDQQAHMDCLVPCRWNVCQNLFCPSCAITHVCRPVTEPCWQDVPDRLRFLKLAAALPDYLPRGYPGSAHLLGMPSPADRPSRRRAVHPQPSLLLPQTGPRPQTCYHQRCHPLAAEHPSSPSPAAFPTTLRSSPCDKQLKRRHRASSASPHSTSFVDEQPMRRHRAAPPLPQLPLDELPLQATSDPYLVFDGEPPTSPSSPLASPEEEVLSPASETRVVFHARWNAWVAACPLRQARWNAWVATCRLRRTSTAAGRYQHDSEFSDSDSAPPVEVAGPARGHVYLNV